MQELPYEAQCELKHKQVRDALQRIGGQANVSIKPMRPAPDVFRYRNKMEFSFHPQPDGTPVLGLHERGTFDRVFAVNDCWITSELAVRIVRLTQRFAIEHRWQAYHPSRHTGVVRYLVVRHLRHTAQCAVHLVASSDAVPGLTEWAREEIGRAHV